MKTKVGRNGMEMANRNGQIYEITPRDLQIGSVFHGVFLVTRLGLKRRGKNNGQSSFESSTAKNKAKSLRIMLSKRIRGFVRFELQIKFSRLLFLIFSFSINYLFLSIWRIDDYLKKSSIFSIFSSHLHVNIKARFAIIRPRS